jgi:hypothetical protein
MPPIAPPDKPSVVSGVADCFEGRCVFVADAVSDTLESEDGVNERGSDVDGVADA